MASLSTASAKTRVSARATLRIAGLLMLFALCAPVHLLTKLISGKSRWPRRFLGAAARVVGAQVRLEGAPIRGHTMLVSNHVSWLDILVLAGGTGCAFVAKADLGPDFVHWLADQNATLYVRRGHVKGSRDQAIAIAGALKGDKPLTLFPEGTTGPGTHLLAFRSTLLEAANFMPSDVAIRPVAIDYGAAVAEIAWHGAEPAIHNVLRVLGRRGPLPVTIHLLEPLDRCGNRKQLTNAAREEIAQTLGFKSTAHSPID